MSETRGRCLCGAVTFAYDGAPLWRSYCHCESCRRQTSSPITAFVGVASDQARVAGDSLRVYASSPGVRRSFCGTCGSPIAFEADRYPGEIHFYTAALEHPEAAAAAPESHVHEAERIDWFEIGDALPRHPHSGQDG